MCCNDEAAYDKIHGSLFVGVAGAVVASNVSRSADNAAGSPPVALPSTELTSILGIHYIPMI